MNNEKKKSEKKITPENPENYKKAITAGRLMAKNSDVSKADVARKIFEFIHDEKREVIAQAFIEGANLTPKGAMTYVYNIRRKNNKNKP